MINIAVTGKGGVGKTTIAGTISRFLAKDGYRVIAVDADPDMNLDSVLGCDASDVVPLAENETLIAERTGSKPGSSLVGGVFKLNPKVDDIARSYCVKAPDDVNLLVMGTVKKGGSGCMCPADAFLRALFRHLVKNEEDAIVLDMEAGIEHLGRGTARSVDEILIVVEPGLKSVGTAERIKNLAEDLNVRRISSVMNKARGDEGTELVRNRLRELEIPFLETIPYDETFVKADLSGKAPLDMDTHSESIQAIKNIERKIIERAE
ncbi:hypothetical protein AKJ64_02170 [candidate division MSBL1 archaeon SCGC-AAA259E17]|uniref:CobQ/CobB/MinD/ParA nucleotide binding domain-containing protein n=1 Tax=candidate division MSBL1 archaeon SCGC-AAA259E17 TaxID=1698263 RepID=A0A133UF78_9EURY|nr:hypothetical protein AKJ64_02170 [candidate division MSBL1 archaeon SCGC-AAA259E17]